MIGKLLGWRRPKVTRRENDAPCPRCSVNLLDVGRFIVDGGVLSTFECPCGLISRWGMNAAVPLLVREP